MIKQGLSSITSYGNYASSNYGAHTLQVAIGTLTIYFSYKTPVAFHDGKGLVCSENVWSTTTGKHLNWIEADKTRRVKSDVFEQKFAEVLKRHGLL